MDVNLQSNPRRRECERAISTSKPSSREVPQSMAATLHWQVLVAHTQQEERWAHYTILKHLNIGFFDFLFKDLMIVHP